MNAKQTNNSFPVFLQLENRSVLIVGAGKVGLEKLTTVLAHAPHSKVKVVAPQIGEGVGRLAAACPQVTLVQRIFLPEDAAEADLVFLAVNDPEESRRIATLARSLGKWVNVADQPALCDFYMGAIVNKGELRIAISTNGASPTLARRFKELFEELIPNEIDSVLHHLRHIRQRMGGSFGERVKKLRLLTESLALDSTDRREEGHATSVSDPASVSERRMGHRVH